MKLSFFTKQIISLFTLVVVLTVSACGAPPKREPYDGADLVGAIDPAMLVGNWQITILNPIPGEDGPTVSTAYRSDGTWTSLVIPPDEQNQDLGPMEFEGKGTWQVNGDSMFGKAEEIRETTGNKFGGLMNSVMSLFMSKMEGTLNAYEISADRMIFVNEESGQATLLTRI